MAGARKEKTMEDMTNEQYNDMEKTIPETEKAVVSYLVKRAEAGDEEAIRILQEVFNS
jgi:hypothetical protein